MTKKVSSIIRRIATVFLALTMLVGVLPTTAFAAEKGNDLPDWHFLCVIFTNTDTDVTDINGNTKYIKHTMSQEEIDFHKDYIQYFKESMNDIGVINASVEVKVKDTPVTEVELYGGESCLRAKHAAALLKDEDLTQYDFVFCIANLEVDTGSYSAITLDEYENGAGHTFVNLWNWKTLGPRRAYGGIYTHEFLHFMERMSARWGQKYQLHQIGDFYAAQNWGDAKLDIILNRAKGEYGTGVIPEAWQNPPHVLWSTNELTIPSNVTNIGNLAFWGCVALSKINIPSNVASIGISAFNGCTNLTEVTMSPGVASIGDQAFYQCDSLTNITIPGSVTSIGKSAFQSCKSLNKAALEYGVTQIGYAMFNGCRNLEEVTIPASVTSIGEVAFQICTNLKSIYIPDSVTSIEGWAFNGSGVKEIYYGGTEEQWKAIKIGERNSPLISAAIHYNSIGPDPEPGTVNAAITSNKKIVQLAGELPNDVIICAASYGNGRMRDIQLGKFDAETKRASFDKALAPGYTLFFLQQGTYAPFCPQTDLK